MGGTADIAKSSRYLVAVAAAATNAGDFWAEFGTEYQTNRGGESFWVRELSSGIWTD